MNRELKLVVKNCCLKNDAGSTYAHRVQTKKQY